MIFSPRWYQADLINKTRQSWEVGNQNVVVVSPPRSGKTPTAVWLSEPFIQQNVGVIFTAHREELVRQLSMTYAEFGYYHRVFAPKDVVSDIIRRQMREYGRSFVDQQALVIIGSVQTINARRDQMKRIAPMIGLWMTDEAHHCLLDNMWGKVIQMFPNAKGVGFTATPGRTDRKSLARSQGGIFDDMVKGVTARQLINEGFICDYRIIAPPSSINRAQIKVGSTGDFTKKGLSDAKKHSTITGDCVASYQKYTPGQQAVVFAVDIAHAHDLTQAYRAAGVRAEMVSSKTQKALRKGLMEKFERGGFEVLVNVDLFGEGLNVEGIEVVVMARPTQSFVLYTQQFFRALTKADGKSMGTIIDHAGNVGYFGKIYGLPDTYNGWELENTERSRRSRPVDPDLVPVTTCEECFSAYEAFKPCCPYCGFKPTPAERAKPEHVEGDLVELDPATLAALRGEIDRIDGPPIVPRNLSGPAVGALERRWGERKEAQKELRYNITLWAGYWRDKGSVDSEIYKRFYHVFGIDMMTAQTLNQKNAMELNERVDTDLKRLITKTDSNGE